MSVFDTFSLALNLSDGRQVIFDPSITSQEGTVTIPAVAAVAAAANGNNLPFLGGGSVNRLPPNTAYANLGRPTSLPPPHSRDVESFPVVGAGAHHAAAAMDFFLNIHYGSLSIHYQIQPVHPRLTMNIRVIQNNEDDEGEGVEGVDNTSFPSCLQLLLEKHGEINYADGDTWNSFFNLRQMNAMVCRALHRFYRLYAVECLPEKLLNHVKEIVERRYIDKKWHAEQLDLTIAWADVEFNTQCNDMADRVIKVGEALEGAGRFLDAALIYKWVAEMLVDKKITNSTQRIDASMAFGFCGLAYRRAEDWSNAERYYVRALHVHPNVLDFNNDGHLNSNILNLVKLYFDIPSDTSPSDVRNIHFVSNVLIGLLYVLGYQPPNSTGQLHPLAKRALDLLNPKVRKVKVAKGALQDCARAGNDVDFWRTTLWMFVRQDHARMRFTLLVDPTHAAGGTAVGTAAGTAAADIRATTTKSQRKQDKMAARGVIATSKQGQCCNPECGVIKEYASFQRCPCHTVLYCTKACQVAHWKEEHKQSCPLRKKKTETSTVNVTG